MKMKLQAMAIFLLSSHLMYAQTATYSLKDDWVSARIANSGSLFWDQIGSAYYHVPASSSSSPIFMATLWMGGLNDKDQEILWAQTYRQSHQYEVVAGPAGNSLPDKAYDRVWVLSSQMIADHIRDPKNPVDDIATWPAHGDTTLGQAFYLAPFVDVDNNGLYEPTKGDYPKIQGDYAAYFIMSEASTKAYSNTPAGGFEVHCMAFIYSGNEATEAIRSTVFVNYRIYNRSQNDYHDFYLAQLNDFDIGNGMDDLAGCDEKKGISYGYNGDDFDDGNFGYGNQLPAFGCLLLNKELSGHKLLSNDMVANPSAQSIYSYLSNKSFEVNGDPTTNTGAVDAVPGERKTLSSVDIGTFKAGTGICFNMAYVFAQSSDTGIPTASVKLLLDSVANLKAFYSKRQGSCFDGYSAVEPLQKQAKTQISTLGKSLVFTNCENAGKYTVYSLTGQVCATGSVLAGNKVQVNTTLPRGVYVVEYQAPEKAVFVRKQVFVR
ncbi:hypothetical protein GC194_03840 [bacterium]|nr:hypothetical protein [bacterium]